MSVLRPVPDDSERDSLVRSVEDLRGRVDRLTEDLDQALTLVDHSLSAVREEMRGGGASGGPRRASSQEDLPPTWCSRDLDDAQTRQLVRVLEEWVTWLRSRYPVAKGLPECWALHPELVEETTALYAAWHGAYRDPQASPWAPADWHDRWLPGFLSRVQRWGVTCTDGDHRERGAAVYGRLA